MALSGGRDSSRKRAALGHKRRFYGEGLNQDPVFGVTRHEGLNSSTCIIQLELIRIMGQMRHETSLRAKKNLRADTLPSFRDDATTGGSPDFQDLGLQISLAWETRVLQEKVCQVVNGFRAKND
jgi:hypothetical protein